MKKSILLIATFLSTAIGASAQGTFSAGNVGLVSDGSILDAPIMYLGSPVTGSYVAQIYWGAGGSAAGSLVALDGLLAVGDAVPGYIQPAPQLVIDGAGVGSVVSLQLRVWDSSTGSSWESALVRGESLIDANYTLVANNVVASAPVWGLTSPDGSVQSPIVLAVVPEPSSLALVGIGAMSIFAFRRKK